MNKDFSEELSFAKQLAQDAKLISDKYYRTDIHIEMKEDNSPVTVADKEINSMVVSRVKEAFPEHGILGEEESWEAGRETLWVCDPVDGTVAFTMGESSFMFSLAMVVDGVVKVAVTLALSSGEMFWSVLGRGSFRDGDKLQVSSRSLKDSWLVFPSSLRRLYRDQKLYQGLDNLSLKTNTVNGGVFKGMMIAQGLSDACIWVSTAINPWDIAAVKLIVEEAGGCVVDLQGKEHRFDNELLGGVVVCSQAIRDEFLAAARSLV